MISLARLRRNAEVLEYVHLSPDEVLALVAVVEAARRWLNCDDLDLVREGEQESYELLEQAVARFE